MPKSKVRVEVVCYDDRGDPDPPNNFRVEIKVGGHTFIYDPRDNWDLMGCMPEKKAEKIAQEVRNVLGTEIQTTQVNYGFLTPSQRNALTGAGKKLLRLMGDMYIDDTKGPGDDYCWECGHIAPQNEFLSENKCPNSNCPNPENWND